MSSRVAQGLTYLPIQWLLGLFLLGVKVLIHWQNSGNEMDMYLKIV
jgi:hypothetical protein